MLKARHNRKMIGYECMKKNVWILNHYASSMYHNQGGRHYWFAKYLRQKGYKPVIFASNTKHGVRERWVETDDLWVERKAEEIGGIPFILVRTPLYSGNGVDRVCNMVGFYHNVKKVVKLYAKKHGRPDVIYASSVHPLTLVAGLQLARHFRIKCICEMRDLWPEAIVVYSNKIKRNGIIARCLYAGEKWIYTKADALIFTQEGGPDYVRERGWDREHGGPIDLRKAYHINNGVDLEAFDKNLSEKRLDDPDLDAPNTFKVVYAGAVRRINNLGLILDAAKLITDPKIRFIIYGDGDQLSSLKQRVIDENIVNVVFKGKVNKQFVPSIVSRSDINLVHWEMSPLLRVGESYNKAFEYFAAGKPVFYTIRPRYSIVEKYKCGVLTDGYDPKDIAEGIENLLHLPDDEKKEMGYNARKTAELYDFTKLTEKLLQVIEG